MPIRSGIKRMKRICTSLAMCRTIPGNSARIRGKSAIHAGLGSFLGMTVALNPVIAPCAYARPSAQSIAQVRAEDSMKSLIAHYWNTSSNMFNNSSPLNQPGYNYWWQANAVNVLAEGARLHLKSPCAELIHELYISISVKRAPFSSYFDDENWMGLGFFDAYRATHDRAYLTLASRLFSDVMANGWQPDGGVVWNRIGSSYRNTPANAPAALLGADLYSVTHNPRELNMAKQVYRWEWAHLVSRNGSVSDGIQGHHVNQTPYSYNYGTVIGAAIRLWQDTGNRQYLKEADLVGRRALKVFTVGIPPLIESEGQGDGGLFNGIFIHYAGKLAISGTLKTTYRNLVLANAAHAWTYDRRPDGVFGEDWSSPVKLITNDQDIDLSTALSGVFLQLQALELFRGLGTN